METHYEVLIADHGRHVVLLPALDVPGISRLFAVIKLTDGAIELKIGHLSIRLSGPPQSLVDEIRYRATVVVCEVDERTGEPVNLYQPKFQSSGQRQTKTDESPPSSPRRSSLDGCEQAETQPVSATLIE